MPLTGSLQWIDPIEEYWVTLRTEGGVRVLAERFDSATFHLEEVPPGSYALSVSPRGAERQDVGTVVIEPGRVTDLGVIELRAGSEVVGLVLSADQGTPLVARCALIRHDPSSLESSRRVVTSVDTGGDGLFRFRGVPAGSYVLFLRATAAGSELQTEPFEVDGVSRYDLGPIGVLTAGSVEVEVIGSSGKPEAGASLSLSTSIRSIHTGTTDASGRCRFGGIPSGPCQVHVTVGSALRSVSGTVEPGRTTALHVDLWNETMVDWEGRLLLADGTAAEELGVIAMATDGSWRSAEGKTGAGGAFTLARPGTGEALLDVYGLVSPRLPVHVPIRLPDRGGLPRLVQVPGGAIEGSTRPPIVGGTVVVSCLGWEGARLPDHLRDRASRFAIAETDGGGRFVVSYLAAGRYRVRVYPRGSPDAVLEAVASVGEGPVRVELSGGE